MLKVDTLHLLQNRLQDKEDKAVAEQALDPKTRILLYKLVNGGVLESINGIISTGKEAVIMHADGGPGELSCVVWLHFIPEDQSGT